MYVKCMPCNNVLFTNKDEITRKLCKYFTKFSLFLNTGQCKKISEYILNMTNIKAQ